MKPSTPIPYGFDTDEDDLIQAEDEGTLQRNFVCAFRVFAIELSVANSRIISSAFTIDVMVSDRLN